VAPKQHPLVNAKFEDGDGRDACPTHAAPDLGSFAAAWIRLKAMSVPRAFRKMIRLNGASGLNGVHYL
jgi:hypothetical protein